MAIVNPSGGVSVTTTATLIHDATGDNTGATLSLHNAGSVNVFLGPSGITAAGWYLAAGDRYSVVIQPGEALYGIVASGTATVNVLKVGAND